MTMCNMEALVSYPKEVMTNVNFFLKNWSNAKVKRLSNKVFVATSNDKTPLNDKISLNVRLMISIIALTF